MFRITYVLGGDQTYRDKAMRILLATLTLVNKEYFDQNLAARRPKDLRYAPEHEGEDDWLDASALQLTGVGDCEELCCYVAGWIQSRKGMTVWPGLEKDWIGNTHIILRMPNGKTWDPTLALGRPPKEATPHCCTGLGPNEPEQKITFVTDLFSSKTQVLLSGMIATEQGYPKPLTHRSLSFMLHALFLIDCLWLRLHPETPSIYKAGVVYKEEPPGREDWQDIPSSIARKDADCEDLATWRSAELVVRQQIQARPTFTWKLRKTGAYLYHIQTTYPDGRVEDPSRTLGMGSHHY